MGVMILTNEGEWIPTHPIAMADERELHTLLMEQPDLLPTDDLDDGDVAVFPVGYETVLGSGYADAIFCGTDGRLTICEVKLRRNAESRREVLAQALSYAAFLEGMTIKLQFEQDVVDPYLSAFGDVGMPRTSLLAKLSSLAGTDLDASVIHNLEENLESGRFRVLIVTDEVHPQLRRSVSYVNRHATFDVYLVGVEIHEAVDGGDAVLVTTMLDAKVGKVGPAKAASPILPSEFVDAADNIATELVPTMQAIYDRLLELQKAGTVNLAGGTGAMASLKVRPGDSDKSIAWIWADGGVSVPLHSLEKLGFDPQVIQAWIEKVAMAAGTPPAKWAGKREPKRPSWEMPSPSQGWPKRCSGTCAMPLRRISPRPKPSPTPDLDHASEHPASCGKRDRARICGLPHLDDRLLVVSGGPVCAIVVDDQVGGRDREARLQ